MSNSLRDQLLKAGLVTEDQIKQADKKPAKRKTQAKKKRSAKSQRPKPAATQNKQAPLSAEEKAKIKAQKEHIRQFLRENKLNDPNGERSYYFQISGKTSHIFVNEKQHLSLINGELAILLRNERHYILSLENAEEMRKLAPESLIFIAEAEKNAENKPSEDDPYADYQVPDDLQW